MLPVLPDGLTPAVDHGMALRAGRGGKHVGHADGCMLLWDGRRHPRAPMPGKLHVRELHLPSGEVLLQMEIKTDQAEHNGDRLASRAGMLHRERIHDVLMNEFPVAEPEGIERKLVEQILIGGR